METLMCGVFKGTSQVALSFGSHHARHDACKLCMKIVGDVQVKLS
jgi:hypothetical protein